MNRKNIYGKRDFKIANVNKEFLTWIRTEPRYKGLSDNRATKQLHDDIVHGKLTDIEVKKRMDNLIKPIEEMIYGKKKKSF